MALHKGICAWDTSFIEWEYLLAIKIQNFCFKVILCFVFEIFVKMYKQKHPDSFLNSFILTFFFGLELTGFQTT